MFCLIGWRLWNSWHIAARNFVVSAAGLSFVICCALVATALSFPPKSWCCASNLTALWQMQRQPVKGNMQAPFSTSLFDSAFVEGDCAFRNNIRSVVVLFSQYIPDRKFFRSLSFLIIELCKINKQHCAKLFSISEKCPLCETCGCTNAVHAGVVCLVKEPLNHRMNRSTSVLRIGCLASRITSTKPNAPEESC